jgi:hypothetical protein
MDGGDSIVGRTFGAWRVASVDGLGKRVVAVCVCGVTRTLARGALTASSARGGCGFSSSRCRLQAKTRGSRQCPTTCATPSLRPPSGATAPGAPRETPLAASRETGQC